MMKIKARILKRILLFISVILLLIALLFVFRYPILRATGRFLISEDPPRKVEAIFILSGSPKDRADEALKLFHEGLAPLLICTGENIPADLEALGMPLPECEITHTYLLRAGMDSTFVRTIAKGSSTKEEADVILTFCRDHDLKEVMVLSSRFHTKRIRYFFEKAFREAGITLNIHGAPASKYRENRWWENEYGLLAVNNEYVKLIYYLIF